MIQINPQYREELRLVLESAAGKHLKAWLAELTPQLITRGSSEDIIGAAGVHAGYEKCLEYLTDFTKAPVDEQPPPAENYPSLDDDDAWKAAQNEVDNIK